MLPEQDVSAAVTQGVGDSPRAGSPTFITRLSELVASVNRRHSEPPAYATSARVTGARGESGACNQEQRSTGDFFAPTMRGENKRHRGGDEEIGATDNHRRGAGSGDPSLRRHSALALSNTRRAGGVSRRRRAREFPACGDTSAWFDGGPSHAENRLRAACHQHLKTALANRDGQTGRGYGCILQAASESSLGAAALFQASTYIAQGLPPDLHIYSACLYARSSWLFQCLERWEKYKALENRKRCEVGNRHDVYRWRYAGTNFERMHHFFVSGQGRDVGE